MFSKLASLALVSCLCAGTIAQRTLEYDIPADEAAALAQVVDDDDSTFSAARKGDESPEYSLIYRKPLPIPPVKQPKQIITNPVTGKDIWYYEIEEKLFTQQVYPNLMPATLVGYDGMSPGPSIVIPRGTESVVRFVNNAQRETSVHLHGSPSRAPFDGWAADITRPGEYKDYYYPNFQSARLLWYHDHALGITAENAYFGLAGAYILTDPAEDALGLPSGYGQFDIPLILGSKFYNSNGTLQSQLQEDTSTWGDVIHVNGQPWPYLDVQPRKYRFRFLNTGISRNYALYFARSTSTSTKLPFKVIASDSGLLDSPVTSSTLLIAVAERYEVVFDFSQFAGQQIELRNLEDVGGFGVDDDYENTDKVMRFNVAAGAVADPSTVPATLRAVPFPPETAGIDHHFEFHRQHGEWLINGVGFEDAANRVLANVPRGTVEIWELENSSGGWTHPIHVHLVDFRVISRTGGDRGVEPYESHGLKDVVWLAKGETVRVEAHYEPWTGLYMFHCHNLIHEDQDMMAAFNVTMLQGFGYDETTDFSDPEDDRWDAEPYVLADFRAGAGIFTSAAVKAKVELLARQQPYSELDAVTAALDDFWEGKDIGDPNAALPRRDATTPAPGPIPRYRRFVV
ncbi:putative bilirubin oxidase [Rosellinia necatrix]|uniref:Putative bilirubin oxidase n=1 Tax=Rosellinia necatrix TaxID=77044 RepID=A0A1S7UJB9_ROSNE|nr:putative bilirubin oxidase [Rosellinia necatrix]